MQAAGYLGFFGYLVARYRRHDRGDCGCARVSARIGVAGISRAGAPAFAGVAATVTYPAVSHCLLPFW